jgi:DNA (cytosine-5)-methyltransferase 1
MKEKYKIIDLFSGCGGLLDGFMQTNLYKPILSIEWEKAPADTLKKRLENKWKIKNADQSVLTFDIQRINQLFEGYEDKKYGKSLGVNKLLNKEPIDFIVGGPPCQSYSVAGRVRDKDGMKYDYRNYLFEYYLDVVKRIKPKIFLLENVPGMLSAMPDGTPIIDLIKRDIELIGYEIIEDVKSNAIIDSSLYGVPQKRKRVIIIGVNKALFGNKNIQKELNLFYNVTLLKYRYKKTISVFESISDLPKCLPLNKGSKPSHSKPETKISWHVPRNHSPRDIKIFKLLAKDIEEGKNNLIDSKKLIELYNSTTGSKTKVHKYHVLRKNLPSTTILSHLYKDGLRFIHYDFEQARTITVREAARLQSFDDDFDFLGSQSDAFKMIGNAVPPKLAKALALALNDFIISLKT